MIYIKNFRLSIFLFSAVALLVYSAPDLFPHEKKGNPLRSAKVPIIVGGEIDYPPVSFIDKNGEPAGFSVDLTRAAARVMGIDIEIRLTSWPEARTALDQGRTDMLLGMFYSEERAKTYDFSPPYSIMSDAIFARKDSPPVSSIEDLRNLEIIIMRGEVMHDYVLKHKLSEKLLLTETPADALRLLSSGKGDYALVAQMPGFYWIRELKLTNIMTVGPMLEPFKNCYVVKKGNTVVLSQFTEGLNILNQTGEYREIYDKWLGVLEPAKITPAIIFKYAIIILIPLLLLLAGSFLWTWMLRTKVSQKTIELQENEKNIREQNQFIETIVNLTPDILYIYDIIESRNVFSNVGLEKVLGYTGEEIKEMGASIIPQLMNSDDYKIYLEKSIPAYASLKDHELFFQKFRMKHKNGDWRWLSCSELIYNRMPDGSPRQIFGVIHDITEEKLAENKIQKSLQEKEILLQEIHHRVKNNMAIISSFIELQAMMTDDPRVEQFLKESRQRIRTMALVHEKLYKSDDFMSINLKEYITQLTGDILSSYGNFSGKNISVIEIDDISLHLDMLIPIGLIINELVTNSVKHAFHGIENPLIEIHMNMDRDGLIKLEISDNGKGLPPDEDKSIKKSLGLMVVDGLIEQLDGEKQVITDRGTKYVIAFHSGERKK